MGCFIVISQVLERTLTSGMLAVRASMCKHNSGWVIEGAATAANIRNFIATSYQIVNCRLMKYNCFRVAHRRLTTMTKVNELMRYETGGINAPLSSRMANIRVFRGFPRRCTYHRARSAMQSNNGSLGDSAVHSPCRPSQAATDVAKQKHMRSICFASLRDRAKTLILRDRPLTSSCTGRFQNVPLHV